MSALWKPPLPPGTRVILHANAKRYDASVAEVIGIGVVSAQLRHRRYERLGYVVRLPDRREIWVTTGEFDVEEGGA